MAKAKTKAIRRAKAGKPIRQVAAVPFRIHEGKPEILLVTSRTTRRFVIPKGWPMKGKTAREAAAIEARQEAGVAGVTRKAPLGSYRYWKRLSDSFVPIEVTVFLLEVEQMLTIWDEAATRERAWLKPEAAARLVEEPELSTLIGKISSSASHGESRT